MFCSVGLFDFFKDPPSGITVHELTLVIPGLTGMASTELVHAVSLSWTSCGIDRHPSVLRRWLRKRSLAVTLFDPKLKVQLFRDSPRIRPR